jgi:raffinose/stachyose/melibiose transport system substrate-binding protein
MKQKIALMLALVLLVMPILGGCSQTSDDGSFTESADGKVVINFFHRWPNEPRNSFYDQKVQEYMELHPEVEIHVDSVLNDSYKEKIRVLVSNEDLPDIFSSWSDSFALNLVSSERIMPLDDILAADLEWGDQFISSQFSGFTRDDIIYGVPFTIDGKAFFYNKEIFAANGITIPKTFDEFLVILDQLQDAGYETPLVEGLKNTWAISHYMGTIFERILDPDVISKDYNTASGEFTDPGYIEGLEVFKQLTDYMGELSTAIDHETARNMFANGEAPIVYMQFAEISMVEDIGTFDFGFFDFPAFVDGKGDPNALTGAPEGWMLNKNAPDEAIDFLKFLTTKETAFAFTAIAGQLNAIKGGVAVENVSAAALEAYDVVMNASATTPWFDNAVNINIADIFMRGGQSLATGQSTPEEIMLEVQTEAKRLRK